MNSVPERVLQPKKPEEKKEPGDDPTPDKPASSYSQFDEMKIAQFLDVDQQDYKSMDLVRNILRMYKDMGIVSTGDVMQDIAKIEGKMNQPSIGVTRIRHFYNYFSLKSKHQNLSKELKAYGKTK